MQTHRYVRGPLVALVAALTLTSVLAAPASAADNTGLKVTAWTGPSSIAVGEVVTFTMTITNYGSVDSSPIFFSSSSTVSGAQGTYTTCPADLIFLPRTVGYVACQDSLGRVKIPAGATRQFSFSWYTDVSDDYSFVLAVQTDLFPDSNVEDNGVRTPWLRVGPSLPKYDLQTISTAPTSAYGGVPFVWTVVVRNNGPAAINTSTAAVRITLGPNQGVISGIGASSHPPIGIILAPQCTRTAAEDWTCRLPASITTGTSFRFLVNVMVTNAAPPSVLTLTANASPGVRPEDLQRDSNRLNNLFTAQVPIVRPTAIIALGDSYIAGEGGRWAGNAISLASDRAGTDRAYDATKAPTVDPTRIYGTTWVGNTQGPSAGRGCHRSDVAEIHMNAIAVTRKINLACSGAKTENVITGGVSFKGEAVQAAQLQPVAGWTRTAMVVLSIGGNDLGFSAIIKACVTAYTVPLQPACRHAQQALVNARIAQVQTDVARSIDSVRAAMRGAGYADTAYRLVVQGAPSPVPRAAENRYPEAGNSRWQVGGCPLWNEDLNWARDQLVPQVNDMMRAAAMARGAEFLDLRNLFQGHEVCSAGAAQAGTTGNTPPNSARSEWARYLSVVGNVNYGGDQQESFHPNAFGQMAIGRCLELLYARPRGTYTCVGAAGLAPTAVTLR
jgi:lysophospholipase L1-like esterase